MAQGWAISHVESGKKDTIRVDFLLFCMVLFWSEKYWTLHHTRDDTIIGYIILGPDLELQIQSSDKKATNIKASLCIDIDTQGMSAELREGSIGCDTGTLLHITKHGRTLASLSIAAMYYLQCPTEEKNRH